MVSTTAPENHPGGAAAAGGLRPLRHVYTANDAQTNKGVFTKIRAGAQETHDDGRMAIDNVFTASTVYGAPSPGAGRDASLGLDADAQDDQRAAASALSAGVASPGGTVCRVVDLAPRHECATRRARNLDYAVVIEGSVVLTLDSGEEALLRRGDVAVQRAASHGWRNPSATEWARMVIVLQDCQPGGAAARRALSEDTAARGCGAGR